MKNITLRLLKNITLLRIRGRMGAAWWWCVGAGRQGMPLMCIYLCIYLSIYLSIHLSIYMYVCIYACIYVCKYVCVCVCVHVLHAYVFM